MTREGYIVAGTSDVLFLTVCSYAKAPGGKAGGYAEGASFPAALKAMGAGKLADELHKRRSRLRGLVADTDNATKKLYRDDTLLSKLPSNEALRVGPDFGKAKHGREIEYYPAIQRYDDTFYRTLGPVSERTALLAQSPHHLLIVSGLYGLVCPDEPIQNYDVNVPEHPKISATWKRDNLLTDALVTYIRHHNIRVVFELIADPAYIRLFDWDDIQRQLLPHGKVLHWECENLTGAAQLYYFGLLTKRLLLVPAPQLSRLVANHSESVGSYREKVWFRRFPARRSSEIAATRLDMMARMRGNIMSLPQSWCFRLRCRDDTRRNSHLPARRRVFPTVSGPCSPPFGRYSVEAPTLRETQYYLRIE